jgi:DNA-binding transcriptional LysR family regulator
MGRDHAGHQPTAGGKVFLSHADTIVDRVKTMLLESREEAQNISGPVNITAIEDSADKHFDDRACV